MDLGIFFDRLFSWPACLLMAVALFGLNAHRRIAEIRRQNDEILALLRVQRPLSPQAPPLEREGT